MELPSASSDAGGSPEKDNFALSGVGDHDSPTEREKSRETSPDKHHVTETSHVSRRIVKEELESDDVTDESPSVSRRVEESDVPCSPTFDKITLQDIAKEGIDIISERMNNLPVELIEELKADLRAIIAGTGGSQHRQQFSLLLNFVEDRSDLTWENLIWVHQAQLEILVAIRTGIQGFLDPTNNLSLSDLVEILLYKRCKNLACRNPLPAHDCDCGRCAEENGFCSCCMCVVCNRFDFETNNFHWVGCEKCSHWTHTDCATRSGLISIGDLGDRNDALEVTYKCQVCNTTSEVLGWLKQMFEINAPGWDRDELLKQLGTASRIFQGSQNPRGMNLYHKFVDLIEQVKIGHSESAAFVFQELVMDLATDSENNERVNLLVPQEACNRNFEVFEEAMRNMGMVAEEERRPCKRARPSFEECDQEVEDDAREFAEMQPNMKKQRRQLDDEALEYAEMQSNMKRQRRQLYEIESLIKLKLSESEMYQLKSQEAKVEADELQKIVLAKLENTHEDFASKYLKRRLSEVESEKENLLKKVNQERKLEIG